MKEMFNNHVCKAFKKQVSPSGQNRLVVGGKADRYPYWISVMDLRREAGDDNKLSPTVSNTRRQLQSPMVRHLESSGNALNNAQAYEKQVK